jgi:polysaccharide deacetylase family protein (PEP-CTERM system associated)
MDIPAHGTSPFLFSIDWEDVRGELVGGFANPDRLPATTAIFLDFLRAHRATVTFFVSGDAAKRHPELVEAILAAGHEVGCHGWRHEPLDRYPPAELAAELREGLRFLRAIGATRVVGFRAPYLSMTARTPWVYDVLADLGFAYSSSVLPGRNPLYGWPEFGIEPKRLRGVHEIPVSVAPGLGNAWPFASGTCFRVLPRTLVRSVTERWRRGGRPLVAYTHPQDVDPVQAHVRYARYGVVGNLLLRANRGGTLVRLGELFADGWRAMPYADYVDRFLHVDAA